MICPECHTRDVELRMRTLDEDETEWFQSNAVVWLEFQRCGNESRPRAGEFVEQPDDAGGFSFQEQFRQWIAGL